VAGVVGGGGGGGGGRVAHLERNWEKVKFKKKYLD